LITKNPWFSIFLLAAILFHEIIIGTTSSGISDQMREIPLCGGAVRM